MKKILLMGLLACASLACNDEVSSTIPLSPVDVELDLNFRDNKLNATLATESIIQGRIASDRLGFGGILVINGHGTNVVNLFAYDLACPVETQSSVKVVPNSAGQATCPKCGAVYNIAYGSGIPESGTKLRLRTYPVYSLGGNKFRVTN